MGCSFDVKLFYSWTSSSSRRSWSIVSIISDVSIIRCFGDKGDVEDITEGKSELFPVSQHSQLQRITGRPTFHNQPSKCAIEILNLTYSFIIADIISTVEFDQTGNYLATGDKGGRVVLFERNDTVLGPSGGVGSGGADWLICPAEEEDL